MQSQTLNINFEKLSKNMQQNLIKTRILLFTTHNIIELSKESSAKKKTLSAIILPPFEIQQIQLDFHYKIDNQLKRQVYLSNFSQNMSYFGIHFQLQENELNLLRFQFMSPPILSQNYYLTIAYKSAILHFPLNFVLPLLLLPKLPEYSFHITFMDDKFDFLPIIFDQKSIKINEKFISICELFEVNLPFEEVEKFDFSVEKLFLGRGFNDYEFLKEVEVIEGEKSDVDDSENQKELEKEVQEVKFQFIVDIIAPLQGIENILKNSQNNVSYGFIQLKSDLQNSCAVLGKQEIQFQDLFNQNNESVIQIFHNLNQNILIHAFTDEEQSAILDLGEPIQLYLITRQETIPFQIDVNMLKLGLENLQPFIQINDTLILWHKDELYEKKRRINSKNIKDARSKIFLRESQKFIHSLSQKYNVQIPEIYTEQKYKDSRIRELQILVDKFKEVADQTKLRDQYIIDIDQLNDSVEKKSNAIKMLDRKIQATEVKRNQLRDKKQIYKKVQQKDMSNFDPKKEQFIEASRQEFVDMERRRINRKLAQQQDEQIRKQDKQEKLMQMYKDRINNTAEQDLARSIKIKEKLESVQQQRSQSQSVQITNRKQDEYVVQMQPSVLQDLKQQQKLPPKPSTQALSSRQQNQSQEPLFSSQYVVVQDLIQQEKAKLQYEKSVQKRKELDQKKKEQLEVKNAETKQLYNQQRELERQEKLIQKTNILKQQQIEQQQEKDRIEKVKQDMKDKLIGTYKQAQPNDEVKV